jgi:hypothetical protein
MTTEDFYAHALLAVYPNIAARSEGKVPPELVMVAAENAAARLTETFEKNRTKYQGQPAGSNASN